VAWLCPDPPGSLVLPQLTSWNQKVEREGRRGEGKQKRGKEGKEEKL